MQIVDGKGFLADVNGLSRYVSGLYDGIREIWDINMSFGAH